MIPDLLPYLTQQRIRLLNPYTLGEKNTKSKQGIQARPGANIHVLGTCVLEYIFEILILVLMEIMGHVFILVLILIFYEYISVLFLNMML